MQHFNRERQFSHFQLIENLPSDFNRLLQNYMQRNPASANYRQNEAVDNVIMDALRYAHKAFIGKERHNNY